MLSKFLDIMASGLSGVNLSGEVEDRDRWEIEHFKGEPAFSVYFGGVLKDYRYGGYVKIYDRDLPEEGRYEWPAGELDYSYVQGVVTVEQLEVDGAYQRMGIATLMFEVLDKSYGYENVVPHQLNEESKLLRANLDAKYGTFHLDNYLESAEEEDDLSGVNLSGEEEGDWYVVWLEDFANALDFDGVQDIASLDYYDWERTGPNRRFRTEKAHYAAWFFDRIASRTTSPEQWFIRYDTLSNYPGGERVFDQMAARKIVPAEGRYYDIIRTSVSEYAYDKFKTHCLNTGTMMLLIQDFPQERKYFVNDACNIPGDRGGFSARWEEERQRWEEERQRNFTGRRWDQDYADEWTSKAKEGLGLDDDWTAPTAAWDEVKALQLLRKLAIVYHPDKGGSTETMQIINNAFDQQDMELLEAYADEAGLSGVSLGDVIRLYGQGPSVKDEIEKIIEESEKDGGEVYFRVSSQDDDLP
jgi:hypothetical protein